MRTLPQALRVPLDDHHALLFTEAGRDPRAGLAAVVFLGRGQETLGFARVLLALSESRTAAATSWAQLNGMPADVFERGLLQAAAQLEVTLREMEGEKSTAEQKKKDPGQGRLLKLEDPEPWPSAVDGADLLTGLAELFARYVSAPEGGPEVLALWTAHSYVFDSFDHTPYLALVSPTQRCGKTTSLTIVAALARRALSAGDISAAALFRVVEQARPTLLIDEADRIPLDSDLWGVLNTGHARGGAVLRVVGEMLEPRAFTTYGPKVLAYIRSARSTVPATVEDRTIRLTLQRKGHKKKLERLRTRLLEAEACPFRRRLMRWTDDRAELLVGMQPAIPEELDDRAADGWEPLLAVADLAGGPWPELARKLAITFSADRAEEERETPGVLLLADLSELLEAGSLQADEHGLVGAEMVRLLRGLPERPWARWGRSGDGLSLHALARLLKPFEVRPELVGPEWARVRRYKENALRGACERMAPEHSGTKCTSAQPSKHGGLSSSAVGAEHMSTLKALTRVEKGQLKLSAPDEADCPTCGRDSCPGGCP